MLACLMSASKSGLVIATMPAAYPAGERSINCAQQSSIPSYMHTHVHTYTSHDMCAFVRKLRPRVRLMDCLVENAGEGKKMEADVPVTVESKVNRKSSLTVGKLPFGLDGEKNNTAVTFVVPLSHGLRFDRREDLNREIVATVFDKS